MQPWRMSGRGGRRRGRPADSPPSCDLEVWDRAEILRPGSPPSSAAKTSSAGLLGGRGLLGSRSLLRGRRRLGGGSLLRGGLGGGSVLRRSRRDLGEVLVLLEVGVDEGEADLPLVDVDADDAHLDLLARLEQVLRLGVAVVGELRDVEQTLEVVVELHEHTEVGDLRDEAGEQVADVVVRRDRLEPRVGGELLAAQGDALLLLVHGEDDALQAVTFLHHLGRVRDLLGPRHVGDVQETVDALLDLDEGAVAREVADGALDDGSIG